jgi:signal transduction histidine kinase
MSHLERVRRLGVRRRLFLVVVLAVGVALAIIIVSFNVLLARDLSREADQVLRSRVGSELAVLGVEKGKLVVARAPDAAVTETNVWVFSGGQALEAPRTGAIISTAARGLSAGRSRFENVAAVNSRLYSQPVVIDGRNFGTVVASVSLSPYESTRRAALIDSLVLGCVVLLVVALAVSWLLSSSLRPVIRMTRQVADWSESDLDRRFGFGEPYDELTELGATLDGLLDRLAASLRRERRFSAELSHELRTPLARVIGEADLALSHQRTPTDYRAALEIIHRNARQLTHIIDALMAAERHAAASSRGTADAVSVATEAVGACADLAAERSLSIEVERPARPVRLGVDGDLAERILQPVLENGCRYCRSSVRISVERTAVGVVFEVVDDGPGVDSDECDHIFEPGARGRVGRENNTSGAGLGLALARRLARGVAGEVEVVTAASHGCFLVRLPAG